MASVSFDLLLAYRKDIFTKAIINISVENQGYLIIN